MLAKIYFNRLVVHTITFDEIPLRYVAAVREYGIEWVTNGKMTVEEYETLYNEPFPGRPDQGLSTADA